MTTTQAQWTPTATELPPEGVEVETMQYDFSSPVTLSRHGQSWVHSSETAKGGVFRIVVNYTPRLWRRK